MEQECTCLALCMQGLTRRAGKDGGKRRGKGEPPDRGVLRSAAFYRLHAELSAPDAPHSLLAHTLAASTTGDYPSPVGTRSHLLDRCMAGVLIQAMHVLLRPGPPSLLLCGCFPQRVPRRGGAKFVKYDRHAPAHQNHRRGPGGSGDGVLARCR